jgi:hypothetical protein
MQCPCPCCSRYGRDTYFVWSCGISVSIRLHHTASAQPANSDLADTSGAASASSISVHFIAFIFVTDLRQGAWQAALIAITHRLANHMQLQLCSEITYGGLLSELHRVDDSYRSSCDGTPRINCSAYDCLAKLPLRPLTYAPSAHSRIRLTAK